MPTSSTRTAIVGGTIVTPDRIIPDGILLIANGRINFVGEKGTVRPEPDSTIIDARGGIILPGFIDTHVHGSGGDDVMTSGADGILRAAENMVRYGTTAWLPTTIAAHHSEILFAISEVRKAMSAPNKGATILGIHLEGPYINPKFKGAQPEEGIRNPDFDELDELLGNADGIVKVMTLAPELPGATELIRRLVANGIVASLGHSECDYETALAAVQAGATYATHLFNAMSGVHHRKPGLAACCLNENGIVAELILDGVHLSPHIADLAWKTKGRDGIALVTDAIAAQGCGDGAYQLGKFTVNVAGPLCTLTDGVTIAGSVLTMNRAAANAAAFASASLLDIAHTASLQPARRCGLEKSKGSLEIGKDGDVAVLSSDFEVMTTLIGGQSVYSASS